jgi:DNA modification methylase
MNMATDIVERNGESAEKVGLTPVSDDWINRVHFGDCRDSLRALAAAGVKVQTCVTSPPYFGLRDYGVDGQIGLEETPEEFIAELVEVFRCVRDVLDDDGTLWVNMGDSYNAGTNKPSGASKTADVGGWTTRSGDAAGARRVSDPTCKVKDLMGIPWMLAFALRADGWYLRQDIIWHKPNPMPESVTDRCTKAHEYLFLLSKSPRYYFDDEAIKEPATGGMTGRAATFDRSGNAVSAHVIPGQSAAQHRARPQQARARELAQNGGLTPAHIDAIRAVGITDAGKAQRTQDGFGKNDPSVQALADEAKGVLGGYYREFLMSDTRNRRSVWTIATKPYKGAHFATFPPDLIEPCILAGSRPGDTVLDCFMGSGTTAAVSIQHGRQFIGCELNGDYKTLQDDRIAEAHTAIAEAQAAADLAARQFDMFAEAP